MNNSLWFTDHFHILSLMSSSPDAWNIEKTNIVFFLLQMNQWRVQQWFSQEMLISGIARTRTQVIAKFMLVYPLSP